MHRSLIRFVQALLENTLCLIGFSGDDRNFLDWIGWIADNLGRRDAPKMYLVGVYRLSDSQKKLLDERNIVCVDLSQYPDIGADDHNKGAPSTLRFFSTPEGETIVGDSPIISIPDRETTVGFDGHTMITLTPVERIRQ